MGRESFVQGLERFDGPFPGLQIKDHIRLVDGNVGAILYYFQGTQTGEFNGIPAAGNKIEAPAGELMTFDEQALLQRLITIEELDRLEMEAAGTIKIDSFQNIPLISNPQTSEGYRAKIKEAASMLHKNFNTGKSDLNAALATADVMINADNVMLQGSQALVDHFNAYNTSFPGLLAYDEYILSDDHYAAVEFIWEGTRNGSFTASNGTVVPPDGMIYRVRGFWFIGFNDAGLMTSFVEVHNNNDFLTQVVNTG